jgi:PTS system mannose-specific IIA component
MIGLVLVTHGRLAEELRAAMEHVVGAQRNVATVCVGPDDDMEGRREEIHRRMDEVDTGDGVVLLTDMFGGTPSNLAISQMHRKGVEVIGGVNLPMLVKLAKVRSNQPLADAVDCAQNAGRKYIAAASSVLPHCRIPHDVTAAAACAPLNGTALNGTTLNGAALNGGMVNGAMVNGTMVNGAGVNGLPPVPPSAAAIVGKLNGTTG